MAEEAETKTNSQGATTENLSEGQGNGGAPKAPADAGREAPADDGSNVKLKSDKDPSPKQGKDEKPDNKEPENKGKETEEEQPEEDDSDPRTVYLEFEDSAGQSVVELLKEAGVKAIEANAMFQEAVESGDLNKVRWDLLEARLGKAKATLAKAGIEQHYRESHQKNEATRTFAYEAVGGEANWNKVTKWARAEEAKNPKFKAEIDNLRSAIDLGGYAAQSAVTKLKEMYEGASGNSGLGSTDKLLRGDQRSNASGAPLSRKDYLSEMHKAQASGDSRAIGQLRERRRAGMAQGI